MRVCGFSLLISLLTKSTRFADCEKKNKTAIEFHVLGRADRPTLRARHTMKFENADGRLIPRLRLGPVRSSGLMHSGFKLAHQERSSLGQLIFAPGRVLLPAGPTN